VGQIDELISAQFATWERRGRGWQVWPTPVVPEPAFRPFLGFNLSSPRSSVDDGHRPALLASLFDKVQRLLNPPPIEVPKEVQDEPEPEEFIRDSLLEIHASLPANLKISKESMEQLLPSLNLCQEPIAFELIGVSSNIIAQFAACPHDAPLVRRQLQAHFPDVHFRSRKGGLAEAWDSAEGDEILVIEFGLAREFMFPLASGKFEPFIGTIGALSELQLGECALFQVLFQPARQEWSESITRSVTYPGGRPLFVNMPELAEAATRKTSRPLYAAVVRIAARTGTWERTLQIARDLGASLSVFADVHGNELIPLENDDYPFDEHVEDLLGRQSRRSGMLLNADELTGFVHLPSNAIRSAAFSRQTGKTKAAPAALHQGEGLLLGVNIHLDEKVPIRLTTEQRVRHTHIIGSSGTGKSTLLFNLIRQDIENGDGVAVLDPHGDLIDRILGIVPTGRINDVILVDPSDEEYSIGFNILSAHSDFEKNLLASDLVSIFKRFSTSWGDQMGSVLNNAILAFLESTKGGTLADLRRFLLDSAFRNEFLKTGRDPEINYYWQKAFPQLGANKSIGPVLTRLEMFLSPKPIRYMVSQSVNRLDFADVLDTGKIFLAKLPQGQVGRENSFLLGSLLVSKFQQLAMSRQRMSQEQRRNFWLYIDEFHSFLTPSMAEILTGARKYRLGLTLAHHELHQLERDPEVASAVMSHPYTRIVFRVGDADAGELEDGFSFFKADDLQNLEIGQAVCRIERSGFDFNLKVERQEEPLVSQANETRQNVITASRKKYATPRAEIEAALFRSAEVDAVTAPSPVKKKQEPTKEVESMPLADTKNAAPLPTPSPSQPPLPSPLPAIPPPGLPVEQDKPTVAPEPGRGGAQHKSIQHRIKAIAEELGYRATEEKSVLENRGSVDLALEKANRSIACEITITTTTDHEFGNVTKCLKAGFSHVAVISSSAERLSQIAVAVNGALVVEEAKRVGYYSVEEFIAYLRNLHLEDAKLPTPAGQGKVSHGYKIKSSSVKLTPEEAKAREQMGLKLIAAAMRKKK